MSYVAYLQAFMEWACKRAWWRYMTRWRNVETALYANTSKKIASNNSYTLYFYNN